MDHLLKTRPERQDIPAEQNAEPFTHAFALAHEASLTEEEQWQYAMNLKRARDALAEIERTHKGWRKVYSKLYSEGSGPRNWRRRTPGWHVDWT